MRRVESGNLGGRRLLRLPQGMHVRPTSARVRAAIFDRLQSEVLGARILDLFAGSGGLSIEALSRGAAHATLIERDPALVRFLRRQMEALGLSAVARVHHADAVRFLLATGPAEPPYDIVLVDPPYAQPELAAAAVRAALEHGWLGRGGVVVCERQRVRGAAPPACWPASLELRASRVHGHTMLEFLHFRDPETGRTT